MRFKSLCQIRQKMKSANCKSRTDIINYQTYMLLLFVSIIKRIIFSNLQMCVVMITKIAAGIFFKLSDAKIKTRIYFFFVD